MKILLIGGAGFIGNYLAKDLLKKGNEVIIFDNFSNSTKKNIEMIGSKNLKVIEGDITKIEDVFNVMKKQKIVIHLAAKISVKESVKNPLETFRINVDGTKNILDACKKNNVNKLIVISSAAVYGESLPKIKLNENAKKNPISPYGESKLKMEEEIKEFLSKHKNFNCTILRFFNVFGVGQSQEYAGVISKFIDRIQMNKSLVIFGDGYQTRDFVSVSDAVVSINNAIVSEKNGIYNIASGKSITVNKLAELMISLSGKKIEIHHISQKKGDVKYSEADISLAKREIGYSPKSELNVIKELLNNKNGLD
jgi:UDP-glucose 4-epimerase